MDAGCWCRVRHSKRKTCWYMVFTLHFSKVVNISTRLVIFTLVDGTNRVDIRMIDRWYKPHRWRRVWVISRKCQDGFKITTLKDLQLVLKCEKRKTWYKVLGGPKMATVHLNKLSSSHVTLNPSIGWDCKDFNSIWRARIAAKFELEPLCIDCKKMEIYN